MQPQLKQNDAFPAPGLIDKTAVHFLPQDTIP